MCVCVCFIYLGLLCGPTIQRCEWSFVAMFGSVLCFIGLVSSSFVNNIYILYATYGIIFGKYESMELRVSKYI